MPKVSKKPAKAGKPRTRRGAAMLSLTPPKKQQYRLAVARWRAQQRALAIAALKQYESAARPETTGPDEDREAARMAALESLDTIDDAEDDAITRAARSDPDAQPVDELFARKPGRPFAEVVKKPVSIRLDPDVIDHFKQDGPGWQGRVNAALRKFAGLDD